MTFDEVLAQVKTLLQQEQRVSYRGLKRRFALDDEYLEDLKEELIGAKHLAIDEDGRFLVWIGNTEEDKGKQITDKGRNAEREGETANRGNGEKGEDIGLRTPATRQSSAERRQLTVMFIDLVGSTTLSQQLDPEDYHAQVQAYQAVCSQVLARYEGYIAQYLGDGVLVYFGYPVAHEDAAVRAVRSGLEIVTAVSQLPLTPPLHLRVGIHTGPVVVAEIGTGVRTEQLALGETPNIAARIQGQANPDEVIISAATYRLVEGLFETENRGQPDLKGIATPLALYRVIKESEVHSRFEVVVRKGLTPLIGREHEFGLLRERWERVKDGTGQVVLLSGEPGIGKSRLVEALKETIEHEGARCLELRCSPYAQNSALQPIIEHLQRTLQFRPEDSAEEKLRKLEAGAQRIVPLQAETIPLLAALLSLPASRFPLPALSPQKQKEKTHEALVAWLYTEAKQQAATYAWEDLHWADPSTLELLTLFLQQVPTARLLLVLTFRPEFTPSWGSHSYLSQLTLSRLGRQQVREMVNHVAEQTVRASTGSARTGNLSSFASDSVRPELVEGRVALSDDLINAVIARTDGVPLFVEELTKSVVESVGATDRSPLQSLEIPSSLQDSLMARLDRLGPAKEIAQLGAMLGREFDYALLQAVSPLHEGALQQGLRQLVESELVYQSGLPPQARYLFKHALVQDTAYQSLLKSHRQQLHQQVAQVLEGKFPQTVETQPELIAHHYSEAGLTEQAIPYWQQAGEHATQRSAYVEAVAQLTKGLELLKTLPDTPKRVQQELTLQIALSTPLIAIKGWAAPEVEHTHERALALCRQVGETPQLFSVLAGLSAFYNVRGEQKIARELGEQLLRLAENTHDPILLMRGHTTLAIALHYLGEVPVARAHFEQVLAWHDPRQPSPTSISCLSQLANVLWELGYPDKALGRINEALWEARQLSVPFWMGYASHFTAVLHSRRRTEGATQEQAEAVITLSTEYGFPFWLGWATLLRGWVLATQGQDEVSIRQIHKGLDILRATGSGVGWTAALTMLAEAYGKVGQIEEGLTALAEALAFVDKTEERVWEAELYRLRGELTLQQFKIQGSEFKVDETERCFLKAIEIARKQQAKSLELRASTSLARLWQQQAKQAEAHKLLSDVYNWFTEGFDTKDLREARTLIEELSD